MKLLILLLLGMMTPQTQPTTQCTTWAVYCKNTGACKDVELTRKCADAKHANIETDGPHELEVSGGDWYLLTDSNPGDCFRMNSSRVLEKIECPKLSGGPINDHGTICLKGMECAKVGLTKGDGTTLGIEPVDIPAVHKETQDVGWSDRPFECASNEKQVSERKDACNARDLTGIDLKTGDCLPKFKIKLLAYTCRKEVWTCPKGSGRILLEDVDGKYHCLRFGGN